MTIRTRIAPSPTGYMHIGTLRTVMFDYFLARQNGGQFIVRIEDTDQARLVDGAVESLLATFKKLGLDYDEGPMLRDDGTIVEHGDCGPYVQSARLGMYKQYADELLEKKAAYVCVCKKSDVDLGAQDAGGALPILKWCDCRDKNLSKPDGDFVLRFKIPHDQDNVWIEADDIIRGHIKFPHLDQEDFIILKSDGFATYHLASVVDDHLMSISHVLRGEEWLSSLPKHVLLYKAFEWTAPVFAHVPLILNPDKTKLSKRKGDVSVESYLAKGYLPEALINFISTLGFNPKSDQEIYTRDELVQLFDLAKVNRSGAVMNIDKLDWMNHHYIMQLSEDALIDLVTPFLPGVDMTSPTVRRALMVERDRVQRLTEFAEKLAPYIAIGEFDAATLVWKKADAADANAQLTGVRDALGALDDAFGTIALLEAAIKEYIGTNGLQNGNVLWPLRVALSGMEKSASPYELLWALGREESLHRIDVAIAKLG